MPTTIPSRHAHFESAKRPWYKFVRPWKYALIIAALLLYIVGQSQLVDFQDAAYQTYQTMRGNNHPTKEPTKVPTARPTPITPIYLEAASKAQKYVDSLHLSEEGLRDRLTSKQDNYTQDMAQYAIENIHADYHNNAFIIAQRLQAQGVTDPLDLMKKLTDSHYKFTPADAEFALRQLFPREIVNSVLSQEH